MAGEVPGGQIVEKRLGREPPSQIYTDVIPNPDRIGQADRVPQRATASQPDRVADLSLGTSTNSYLRDSTFVQIESLGVAKVLQSG
jgi:hypothetical protein